MADTTYPLTAELGEIAWSASGANDVGAVSPDTVAALVTSPDSSVVDLLRVLGITTYADEIVLTKSVPLGAGAGTFVSAHDLERVLDTAASSEPSRDGAVRMLDGTTSPVTLAEALAAPDGVDLAAIPMFAYTVFTVRRLTAMGEGLATFAGDDPDDKGAVASWAVMPGAVADAAAELDAAGL